MSLKQLLIDQIEAREGEVFTYDDLVDYCRVWGFKISNAERRLRECHDIEKVFSKKGAIIGYRITEAQQKLF